MRLFSLVLSDTPTHTQAQCQAEEEKGSRLQEQLTNVMREVDRARQEVDFTNDTLEQYKLEKQKLCRGKPNFSFLKVYKITKMLILLSLHYYTALVK